MYSDSIILFHAIQFRTIMAKCTAHTHFMSIICEIKFTFALLLYISIPLIDQNDTLSMFINYTIDSHM